MKNSAPPIGENKSGDVADPLQKGVDVVDQSRKKFSRLPPLNQKTIEGADVADP